MQDPAARDTTGTQRRLHVDAGVDDHVDAAAAAPAHAPIPIAHRRPHVAVEAEWAERLVQVGLEVERVERDADVGLGVDAVVDDTKVIDGQQELEGVVVDGRRAMRLGHAVVAEHLRAGGERRVGGDVVVRQGAPELDHEEAAADRAHSRRPEVDGGLELLEHPVAHTHMAGHSDPR